MEKGWHEQEALRRDKKSTHHSLMGHGMWLRFDILVQQALQPASAPTANASLYIVDQRIQQKNSALYPGWVCRLLRGALGSPCPTNPYPAVPGYSQRFHPRGIIQDFFG